MTCTAASTARSAGRSPCCRRTFRTTGGPRPRRASASGSSTSICRTCPTSLIGPAVGQPVLADPLLRQRIRQLHEVLGRPGEEFEAEHRLAFIAERLCWHLRSHGEPAAARPGAGVAGDLRELIDARFREKVTLRDASDVLHAHPAHLVRAFGREFGISPHQYLTSRRVDLARRLLLGGVPPSLAAAEAGFYDQSHLTRHFRHVLGTSPGKYAKSGPG